MSELQQNSARQSDHEISTASDSAPDLNMSFHDQTETTNDETAATSSPARKQTVSDGTILLSELPAGSHVVIVDITEADSSIHRLQELGLVPGTPITVKQTGDPMLLSIFGATLAISKRQGECFHTILTGRSDQIA